MPVSYFSAFFVDISVEAWSPFQKADKNSPAYLEYQKEKQRARDELFKSSRQSENLGKDVQSIIQKPDGKTKVLKAQTRSIDHKKEFETATWDGRGLSGYLRRVGAPWERSYKNTPDDQKGDLLFNFVCY